MYLEGIYSSISYNFPLHGSNRIAWAHCARERPASKRDHRPRPQMTCQNCATGTKSRYRARKVEDDASRRDARTPLHVHGSSLLFSLPLLFSLSLAFSLPHSLARSLIFLRVLSSFVPRRFAVTYPKQTTRKRGKRSARRCGRAGAARDAQGGGCARQKERKRRKKEKKVDRGGVEKGKEYTHTYRGGCEDTTMKEEERERVHAPTHAREVATRG